LDGDEVVVDTDAAVLRSDSAVLKGPLAVVEVDRVDFSNGLNIEVGGIRNTDVQALAGNVEEHPVGFMLGCVEVDRNGLAASEVGKHQARMKAKYWGDEGRPLVKECGNHCETVEGGTGYSASTHAGRETKPLLSAVFEFMSMLLEKVREVLVLEAGVEVENAKGL
jgi:hypothetical protein